MIKYTFSLIVTASILLSLGQRITFAQQKNPLEMALDSITEKELGAHAKRLSDDSFEGRESGSRGGRVAGNYIASFADKAKLLPAGDNGTYFQNFGTSFRNVIGYFEGSDPKLKNETIMIGAHYDHVGYGNQSNSFGPIGRIHNGADDNASGTSALLEMIDAFSKMEKKPARTIMFAFWDAEERGLYGSWHFVRNKIAERQKVKLYINMDMVGRLRNNNLEVYGTRTSTGLRRLLTLQNSEEMKLGFDWELKEDSDHYPFAKSQVPALMLHTGLHERYHRPTDDFETINISGIRKVSVFATRIANAAANVNQLPGFRSQAFVETDITQKSFEAPIVTKPLRLGVNLSESSVRDGIFITSITKGSPAEKAGIQLGDKIVKLDEIPITGTQQFVAEVQNVKTNQTKFTVIRSGQTVPIEIVANLRNTKRIGITWKIDNADPATFLIGRVEPSSAAEAAKLRVGDRVMFVNGKVMNGEKDLVAELKTAPSPIILDFEREGIVRRTSITPNDNLQQ